MAAGTVSAAWHGECRRCGGPVEGRLVAEVRERFVRHSDLAGAATGATAAGASPDDEEAYSFHDDLLDLEPLAREAVLLELPLAPLCAEACRGLCPSAGPT